MLEGNGSLLNVIVKSVSGYAVAPYPVTLEDGKAVVRWIWQLGPKAPAPGSTDLVLLSPEGFWPVAVVPKGVVKLADIHIGDYVTTQAFGTTKIYDGAVSTEKLELPEVPIILVQVATGLLKGILPEGWGIWINGFLPGAGRKDLRYEYKDVDNYYPVEPWNLGTDYRNDPVTQRIRALYPYGRGQKLLMFGDGGSGKTVTATHLLRETIRNNDGRPIYAAVCIMDERREDIGALLRTILPFIYEDHDGAREILRPGVAGFESLCVSADFKIMFHHTLRIAQLAAMRVQRLAETAAAVLPPEECPSFYLLLDGIGRAEDAMDRAQVGGVTRSGGRDIASEVMAAMLQYTGRAILVTEPDGSQRWIDVTVVTTLLGNPHDRTAMARIGAHRATTNAYIQLSKEEDWPEGAEGPAVVDPIASQLRNLGDMAPEWEVRANRLLRQRLRKKDRNSRTIFDPDGHRWFEEQTSQQPAEALLKSMVKDMTFPKELQRARELIEEGKVFDHDPDGPARLRDELVLPHGWGSEIWDQLALEGLVWPQDILRIYQYASQGLVKTPDDIRGYLKRMQLGDGRIQELWNQLLEWGVVEENSISEKDPEAIPPKSGEDPEVALLAKVAKAIEGGKVFHSAEVIQEFFHAEEDLAWAVWDDLSITYLAKMALKDGCPLDAGRVQHRFGCPFGEAKDVVKRMRQLKENSA